ncbi:MAG: hypothetical protein GY769_02625 [bacterium]|nr:hypothetical protein [bacterium]
MQLIMDVANDLLDNEELPEELWEDIVELLNNRRTLHSDLIEHWVLEGETLDDAFALTPYVRRALGMP